jgi:pimeloyl-ACP methyl ester carboxylesterase
MSYCTGRAAGWLNLTGICASLFLASACNKAPPPAPKPSTATPSAAATPAPSSETLSQATPAAADADSATTAGSAASDESPGDAATSATPAKAVDAEGAARAFVDAISVGDFDQAVQDFDETMMKVMPAEKLKQTWATVEQQAGKFQKRRSSRIEKISEKGVDYDVALVTCDFENTALDAKIIYTPDRKITGLFFIPVKTAFAGKEQLWLGELNAGAKLRILIHLGDTADGKLVATFDSLDQGAKGIPFDSVSREEDKVRFESKALKVVYEGTLNEAGDEITGEWQQGGAKFPLNLKKVDSAPQTSRPQFPKPPFNYDAIEVGYENPAAKIKLAGTLTVPNGTGPHPAAILITGSGSQDRDETIFEHKPFYVLADYLTRRGIAVLRVDDRGVGGTTKGETEATSADLAIDVQCGITFLKGRSEIDPARIGLIGHSEGGIIAPLVASQTGGVAFIVMLAGSTVDGEQILYEQGAALLKAGGASDQALANQREMQARIIQIVKTTPDTDAAVEEINKSVVAWLETLDSESLAALGNPQASVAAQSKRLASPWFRFFLTYDPRPALTKVRCPLLALNGAKDLQVLPQQNLPVLREALAESQNADFEIHELPDLNHLFQTCKTGSVAEYAQIEETFAPSALQRIGDWIAKRFVAGK